MSANKATTKRKSPPEIPADDAALAEAEYQIEAMTGKWDTPVRLRLIDQRHDVPKEKRRGAIQLCGSLGDDEFCRKLWEFNCDGYDVYVVAQETCRLGPAPLGLPADEPVNQKHITQGRIIVADFDDIDFPREDWYWHIPPTFILRRENSDRHFWAVWCTEIYDPRSIRDIHKRVIRHYNSDPAVCDPARIIRLAGLYSYKREEKTRYVFQEESVKATTLDDHKAILPEVKRKSVSEGDWDSDDYVSEKRLRFLLKNINPECNRHKWISFLGAIKDARIGRDDFTYMELFDKYELADEWSSGELGGFTPTNYVDIEDVTDTLNSLTRDEYDIRATVGSLIHAAKEARIDELTHQRLRRAEPFTHPDNAPKTKDHEPKGKDDAEGKSDPELAPLRIQSFAQALTKEPKPVVEIIPDRVEKGMVNFLSGPGGSHKSRLVLQYCLCVQARKPIFGAVPAPATPVYVSAEDSEDEVVRRTHKLVQRLDLPPDILKDSFHIDRYSLDNALARMRENGRYELTPFYGQLGDYITGLPGHKFVVLDSAYDFVRFEGSAKINEDAVNAFIKEVLGGFCRDTNSTLLVPWHPSYAGQERGDGSGWSVAWHNAPRVKDAISRVGNGDGYELKAVKRNHGALPPPLTLYYSDGALLPREEFECAEQKAQLDAACIEVATLCAEKGIPITQQRRMGQTALDLLRKRIEVAPKNTEFKDILTRAVIEGHLEYVQGGTRRSAGFYPSGRGDELARTAKYKAKGGGKTEGKTGVKPGGEPEVKPG